MKHTATEMLAALASKISKEELRRQIDELRRDPATGDIRMSTVAAISVIHQRECEGVGK